MLSRPELCCRNRLGRVVAAVLLPLAALAACKPVAAPSKPVIGLSTSLPILWGEGGDIRGQLGGEAPQHWALAILENHGQVLPLDTLAGPRGSLPLPREGVLVLAQPRPFMPEENVALDGWVRNGGRLLVFADPMLTAPSRFALGDPRAPQQIVMLSPILRHWGLELRFDPEQPGGEHLVDATGTALTVDLAGSFAVSPKAHCRLEADAVVADCRIGKGRVLAVGDASVFDGDDAGRRATFAALLERIAHR
jgi:hypothetical protein